MGCAIWVLVPAIGRTLIQQATDSSPSKGRQGYLPVDEGANVDKTVSSHFLWEEGTESVKIFKNFWLATEALSGTRESILFLFYQLLYTFGST